MDSPELPGDAVRRKMESLGMDQADLAFILGRAQSEISAVILNKRPITPALANELAEVLGESAQFWLSLQAAFAASRAKPASPAVGRRRRLFESFPVRDMIKRGWIAPSDDVDSLEREVCSFFDIASIDASVATSHAARKSTSYEAATPAQAAWIRRVRQLGQCPPVGKFNDKALGRVVDQLQSLTGDAEEARHVPRVLSEAGIRFAIVECLPSTKIDGVCTWLNPQSPVIGLSVRFDRIDTFWHTLFHEIFHVINRDGLHSPVLDVGIVGEESHVESRPDGEIKADEYAANASVPASDLNSFIARTRPLYSKLRIRACATRLQIHPGILVGQLQHRGEIPFSHFRELLEKVRQHVLNSAITDGWGHKPIISSGRGISS